MGGVLLFHKRNTMNNTLHTIKALPIHRQASVNSVDNSILFKVASLDKWIKVGCELLSENVLPAGKYSLKEEFVFPHEGFLPEVAQVIEKCH